MGKYVVQSLYKLTTVIYCNGTNPTLILIRMDESREICQRTNDDGRSSGPIRPKSYSSIFGQTKKNHI